MATRDLSIDCGCPPVAPGTASTAATRSLALTGTCAVAVPASSLLPAPPVPVPAPAPRPAGPAGAAGIQGAAGPPGLPGAVGPIGPAGPTGATGPAPIIQPGSFLGLPISAGAPAAAIEITGAQAGENIRYANIVTDSASSGAVGVYTVTETVNTQAITAPAPLSIAGLTILSLGKEVTIYNAGVNLITLKQEDLSVAAGSRFSLPGSVDLILNIGDAAVVRNTASRWRCLNNTKGTAGTGTGGGSGPGMPGADGDPGAPGDPGPPGMPGAAGQPGTPGAPGADGAQGEQGDPGPPGTPGTPGATGASGADGAAGVPGAAGADGAQGEQGDPGFPGMPGAAGLPGTPGAPGDAGAQGDQGDQGDPGPPGTPGATGASGASGADGAPGAIGFAGDAGDPGDQGDPGFPGIPGAPGQPGVAIVGPQGEQGEPGEPGPPGLQGPAGIQGATGTSGVVGSVLNTAVVNFGVPATSGSFQITGLSGLIVNTPIDVSMAVNTADPTDSEQQCWITGIATSSSAITCYWNSGSDLMSGTKTVQYITSTSTGNLTLSPGQFVGLPIDAGANGPAIAITGAQGGENIRFGTTITEAGAGPFTDYPLGLGTTMVVFTAGSAVVVNGFAGGSAGREFAVLTNATTTVKLANAAGAAGNQVFGPGNLTVSHLNRDGSVLRYEGNTWRVLDRARSAVQANGGAISPAETLSVNDSTNADFLPTLSVSGGVASISANLGYASQAVFDAGFASALPLASNLRGFPGSFCSNLAAITTINSTARNATLGVTPGGGVAVLQSIPAVTVANAGQAYLLYGFFSVVRGGTATAANITFDAQCAGVTQTEVPGIPIPVALNVRYGGMMLALLHIETLGVAGTATLRAFGGAGSLTQAFADLASSGSLITPFTINTTITNTVSLGMTMSGAVPNLQTSWNSCGIIKLYV